jgi:hypothetical protein
MKRLSLASAAMVGGLLAGPSCAQVVFPPGVGLGLPPPQGIAPSPSTAGFERSSDGASFVLFEAPPEACAQMRGVLTPERLAAQGVRLEATRTLTVGGREATLVTGTQHQANTAFSKWVLLACDDIATGLVTVQVPGYPPDPAAAAEIEAALASMATRRV